MLLAAKNISKRYDAVQALQALDFDLRAGEVHALIGENGAGKSTFIKILSGMQNAEAGGSVHIHDQQQTALDPQQARQAGIAVIYQNPTLFDELSVCENLCIGSDRRLISWRRRRQLATALMQRVGLSLSLDQPVRRLRMAEKQLLEIARALRDQAAILIMDEPTASLPQHDAEHLMQIIRELRQQGTGIIYISHRLEEIQSLADRVTVLRDGRHIGTFDTADIERERMIQLMAGRSVEGLEQRASTARDETVLEVTALSHAAAGLRDISFKLQRGEILGFCGLVGSGRTELARCLCGLTPADNASIKIDGAACSIENLSHALKRGMVYVPEDRLRHGIVSAMSVEQNISLAMLRNLSPGVFIDRVAERALAERYAQQLRIKMPDLRAALTQLSGGNQQKVVLARWLACQPRILILDEPCQGIDVGAKAEIYQLIRELAAGSMSIILISSEMPELLGLADRIAVMQQGRLVDIQSAAAATQESLLDKAMMERSS